MLAGFYFDILTWDMPRYPLGLLLFLSLVPALWGQTATPTSTFTPTPILLKPIQMRQDPLLGVLYFQEGAALYSREQFKALIDPLHDYEADRLLEQEKTAGDAGEIFHWVGLAALTTGLVGVLSSSGNDQTPFWGIGIGGTLSFNLGNLFASDAKSARFNAVQRYNRFARGEEQVLPKPQEDEKSLLNMDFLKPTPTPTAK